MTNSMKFNITMEYGHNPLPKNYEGYLLLFCPMLGHNGGNIYQVVYYAGLGVGNDECGDLSKYYTHWAKLESEGLTEIKGLNTIRFKYKKYSVIAVISADKLQITINLRWVDGDIEMGRKYIYSAALWEMVEKISELGSVPNKTLAKIYNKAQNIWQQANI